MSPLEDPETYRARRGRMFHPKSDLLVDDCVLRSLPASSDADLGFTPEHLRRAFEQALGSAAAEITRAPHQGTFHRLFKSLVGGEPYLLRASVLSDRVPDHTLHLERWAAGQARTAGVPVADVIHVDTSRAEVPFDFQVVSELPGTTLRAYDQDGASLEPLLEMLGGVVARLHGVEMRGFGLIDTQPLLDGGGPPGPERPGGTAATWHEYIQRQLDAHLEACLRAGDLRPDAACRARELLTDGDLYPADPSPALLHGDLGNHNVLTDGTAVTALLDWEDCLAGDPIYDIAFWATFHPPGRHEAFLGGYRAVHELPEDFSVRFWLYFLRIALAKTVHRRRFGYEDLPGRAPASRRIDLGLERTCAALAGSKELSCESS